MKQSIIERNDFEANTFPLLKNLYRLALYMVDKESDAKELVLESFARAYCTRHEYKFSSSCRIWLFEIMVDTFISKYRLIPGISVPVKKTKVIDEYPLPSLSANRQPIEDSRQFTCSAISENDIKKSIRGLPDGFRLIVVLSQVEGFSYREIAIIMDINLETVRMRLRQARKLMKRNLYVHNDYANKVILRYGQYEKA